MPVRCARGPHPATAARRGATAARVRAGRPAGADPNASRTRADGWLRLFDEELAPIEAACRDGGGERYALFRDLDPDLWALLLTQEYDSYPNIRELLPDVPEPALQELWNGLSGVELARQSRAFYVRLCERFKRHSDTLLGEARVLDFGCGWGRLTRFLARDVPAERLHGCDPVDHILAVCRGNGVPATLALSDFVPLRLPFDERFDLAYAFSVFTTSRSRRISPVWARCTDSLRPDGILVATVRPVDYVRLSPALQPLVRELERTESQLAAKPHYLFVPHPAEPTHLQYEGGEMTSARP